MPVSMTDDKLRRLAHKAYAPGPDMREYIKTIWQVDDLDSVDRAKFAELRHEFVAAMPGVPGSHAPPEIAFWLHVECTEDGRILLRFIAEFESLAEAIEAGEHATDLGKDARFAVLDTYMAAFMYDSDNPYDEKR